MGTHSFSDDWKLTTDDWWIADFPLIFAATTPSAVAAEHRWKSRSTGFKESQQDLDTCRRIHSAAYPHTAYSLIAEMPIG